MKIRGWSIDGFGHFRDYEVTDLGDGLTVFHGPNEAGKSTLLAFIRGMLFGFPDRRSRDARYEPLRGGRHGGRLLLEVDGERWTLEREAGARGAGVRVFTPRGEGSDEDLRRALGSADTRLFRSVFAFSLTELQSFDTLSDEGARSRIFSAGIVGAGRAARQVIGELGERADALFKPRGRTQLIPTLLRQLAERRQNTAVARRAARGYPDLVREEEACLAEQLRLAAAVAAARRDAKRYEALLGHWLVWNDLQEAESQYAALEVIEAFPVDPERRLAETTSHLEAARAREAEARQELESAEARVLVARSDVREGLAALAPEVATHYETRNLHRDVVQRLHTARIEVAHAADRVDRSLRALGDGWDEERLAAFDVSLPQRDRIRTWGDQLRGSADELRVAEREHAAATRALHQADRDVEHAAEHLRAAPQPDTERLAARDAALRRLRVRLAERREREHTVAQREAVWEERVHAHRLLESQAEPEPAALDVSDDAGDASAPRRVDADTHSAPEPESGAGASHRSSTPAGERVGAETRLPAAGAWILPVAVVAFGLIFAWLLATVRPELGVVAVVLTVLMGVGAMLWTRRARAFAEREATAARQAVSARLAAVERAAAEERQAATVHLAAVERAAAVARRETTERLAAAERAATARRQAHAARLAAAADHALQAREAAERAQRDVESVSVAMAPDIAMLGLRGQPTLADLDEIERHVLQQRQEAARAEQLRHALTEAESRRVTLRDQDAAAARRVEETRRATDEARREWEAWASTRGIPEAMGPESALDFVPAVEQARELLHAREKLRTAAQVLETEVSGWEARAAQLLARAGLRASAGETGQATGAFMDALHLLHRQCEADRVARDRLVAADADLQQSRVVLNAAESELRRREEAWGALLAEAGAGDEAQYRRRVHTFGERQRLGREIERLRRQLTARIGDGPDAESARMALATGAVGEWEGERERHEEEAGVLDQQLEQAIRAHQDAQRRREVLESSADIAGCEAEEQTIVTELHGAVERWRTVTLARALTEVTLQEYVRTRQPAVVAQASGMFATVTDGAFTEVRQNESGEGLSVVTRRGEVLSPEHLSRGTAEQLYLCLRLGLAAEFGSHGAQLPLVMDDVCVNFDPERAQAVASVLRVYAGGQQILFFTCHPATVEMLRRVVPELRAYDMPRHALSAPHRVPVSANV